MRQDQASSSRTEAFRAAIATFIEEQQEAKLKGKGMDAGTAPRYDYATWLANSAARAASVQFATHPLKATFPDAKIRATTSPFIQGRNLPQHWEVGSHLILHDVLDGTGDAAWLVIIRFLGRVMVEGRPLLHWLLENDEDLLQALDPDRNRASQLADSFKQVIRTGQASSSHSRAKQVYWLVGESPAEDGDYHLLQPLFSSSLAHVIHLEIQDARFGEANKLARQAFFQKKPHEAPYRDYRNLVARKLGGTKPQNISQLNSERGGINYLLASLPPKWDMQRPRALLYIESAMERLTYFKGLRQQVAALADFLRADPPPNEDTRRKRRQLEQELGQQLALFAAEIHARFEPGWSRDPACELPLCERLWLDPERAELPPLKGHEREDEDFRAAYHAGNWPDEVAGRFANWVNEQLRRAGLLGLGDTEYRHWARQAVVDAAWPVPVQRRAPQGAHV